MFLSSPPLKIITLKSRDWIRDYLFIKKKKKVKECRTWNEIKIHINEKRNRHREEEVVVYFAFDAEWLERMETIMKQKWCRTVYYIGVGEIRVRVLLGLYGLLTDISWYFHVLISVEYRSTWIYAKSSVMTPFFILFFV